MSMTAEEARTEIRGLYLKANEIEKKYPDGLTKEVNHEDFGEVQRLLGEVDGVEGKLEALDEAEKRRLRIKAGTELYSRPLRPDLGVQGRELEAARQRVLTPGEQFVEDEAYKAMADRGLFNNPGNRIDLVVPMAGGTNLVQWAKAARYDPMAIESKALVYSGSGSGGALVQRDRQPGIVGILQRPIVITDLIPQVQTGSNLIEYVLESAWTNNAAPVAEATATTGTSGAKPESVLSFSSQTAPVRTIAHWVPATTRLLADGPALRGYINTRLLGGLDQVVETQVLNGDGTGENMLGILQTPGVLNQAITGSDVLGAIWAARTQVRTTGLANPTVVVMNPTNYSAIRLARETGATGGQYLMGPPSQLGPSTVWGMQVVEAQGMPAGTLLVADFSTGSTYYDREDGQVRTGYINDQFTRNMLTLLAETRGTIVTYRPTAYCKVTGAP